MSIKGRLIFFGQALYDALDIELSVEHSPSGSIVYVGEFSIPGPFSFDPDGHYQLSLSDGRYLDISLEELRLISHYSFDRDSVTTIFFRSEEPASHHSQN